MKRLMLIVPALFLVIVALVSVAQSQISENDYPLLGKTAPTFSLDTLDGQKLDLAQHKGKDIVVLDFWATWCPPCRASLPRVVKVMDEYKAKVDALNKNKTDKTGLVFYGINQKESEDQIRAFFEKMNISFPTALDRDSATREAYQVPGIPTSVIIDKDGIVQAAHIGAAPDLDQRLRLELDTLLAGKKLIDPKPNQQ